MKRPYLGMVRVTAFLYKRICMWSRLKTFDIFLLLDSLWYLRVNAKWTWYRHGHLAGSGEMKVWFTLSLPNFKASLKVRHKTVKSRLWKERNLRTEMCRKRRKCRAFVYMSGICNKKTFRQSGTSIDLDLNQPNLNSFAKQLGTSSLPCFLWETILSGVLLVLNTIHDIRFEARAFQISFFCSDMHGIDSRFRDFVRFCCRNRTRKPQEQGEQQGPRDLKIDTGFGKKIQAPLPPKNGYIVPKRVIPRNI